MTTAKKASNQPEETTSWLEPGRMGPYLGLGPGRKYNHPEVDRIWDSGYMYTYIYIYVENLKVLPNIIVYLLQDAVGLGLVLDGLRVGRRSVWGW